MGKISKAELSSGLKAEIEGKGSGAELSALQTEVNEHKENDAAHQTVRTGTFIDVSTVIPASGTYVKTIPIGINANKGKFIIQGDAGGTNRGCIIKFNTEPNDSIALTARGSSSAYIVSKHVDNLVSHSGAAGVGIHVLDCYIDGTNINITFVNTRTSEMTLTIHYSVWEVRV